MKFLFRRSVFFSTLILVQLSVLVLAIFTMAGSFLYVYSALVVLSLTVVAWLINSNENPSTTLGWTILALSLPLVGGLFYFLFGRAKVSSRLKKKSDSVVPIYKELLPDDKDILDEITDDHIKNQIQYLKKCTFPVYRNIDLKYLPSGEEKFAEMCKCLNAAKKYIFLEYFIISSGKMWDSILKILIKKAKEGLDIRLIYDDCGCLGLLPINYADELSRHGIKCRVFNPFVPSLTVTMNNRDHRKILVIDGEIAFTGGINLSDEYINVKKRYGHWKDCAIVFKGDAVITMLSLFLEGWNLISRQKEDIRALLPEKATEEKEHDGYIQPFGDSPFDNDIVGENVYLNMINKAKREILIMTPYLIIDHTLTSSLCLAAKNGITVKILTPGIADKWYVHNMTQSSYPHLIKSGVEIIEYTPGFMHSKVVCCDGEIATVGTVNFDYRSLYLHFECGAVIYKSKIISKIRDDFYSSAEKSKVITLEDCKSIKWYKKLFSSIFKVFAPLM